jgi:hypothetical protein
MPSDEYAAPKRECMHPVEMRVLAVLGHNHYCPPCGSVLTTEGPEKVRITKMVMTRG